MDTVKGILLLLVLLLAASTFILFVQSRTAGAQLEDAKIQSKLTLDLLRAQGVTCTAAANEFQRVSACVQPLLQAKDFKEDGFAQPKDATPGYLVIKNINKKAYRSEDFSFSFNREVLRQGCHITGDIGYNVVCRFEFTKRCADGDVLEVNYTTGNMSTKVFTKNC